MGTTDPHLSRRALFGAGLARAARTRFDAQAAEPGETAPRAPRWTAEEWDPLALRGAESVARLLDALSVGPGDRLLDVAAGESPLAAAASARGAGVLHAHPRSPRLPYEDGSFDAAGSLFGVVHAPDMRGIGRELERVLRPGGRLALVTWASSGALGALLRLARGARTLGRADARPERWGSYEGLMLALERFPGFVSEELALTWCFTDADELWRAVSKPQAVFDDEQRALVERRLQPFLRDAGGALELRVDAQLVTATCPG